MVRVSELFTGLIASHLRRFVTDFLPRETRNFCGFFSFFLGEGGKLGMDRPTAAMGPGLDLPIMHDSDRYELVKDIGSGNFGVARLMTDRQTNELVAVKYIERGEKVRSFLRLGFTTSFYVLNNF